MTPRLVQLLSYCVLAALLLGVFMLYTRPEFLVMLADQVWACF